MAARRDILLSVMHAQVHKVESDIDYLVAMVQEWQAGRVWSTKKCPQTFDSLCSLILVYDPDIPTVLYGHTEASLRALAILRHTDTMRYEEEVERNAVAWVWDEMQAEIDAESIPLPNFL